MPDDAFKAGMVTFNGVKVFSATMVAQRQELGEVVTRWIAAHPAYEIVDIVITQSSDARFHCVTISVFFIELVRSAGTSRRK